MTKVVTVINQKGGSGKTNVAMTLAGAFGARGYRTLLVDGDVQGTATRWYAAAPEDEPFPAAVINLAAAGGQLGRAMKDHVDAYDVVLVDTPGSLRDPVPLASLLLSDLALVPMIPSPGDLWATSPLIELIEQARGINPELEVRVVPNMVQSTTLAGAALEALEQMGLPLTSSILSLRTAYRQAVAAGATVLSLRDPKAAAEAESLADEILLQLGLAAALVTADTAKAG